MAIFPIDKAMSNAMRNAKLRGVHLAIVVDNKDGAENPGYRCKVKIPTLAPDDNSWWARIAIPMAGNERGTYMLPEIDDQVLVVFEHGDIGRPLVLGMLWNGKDKAVDNNADGKNARRVIKSKTKHKITFEDVEKYILIEDGAGIGSVKIDAQNNKIEITAKQGDVAVQCKEDMQIFAGEVAITAKGNCDLMGKSSGVDASSTASFKVNGNMVALKGSTIDVNPGGVPKAAKASGTVADSPDPVK